MKPTGARPVTRLASISRSQPISNTANTFFTTSMRFETFRTELRRITLMQSLFFFVSNLCVFSKMAKFGKFVSQVSKYKRHT